MPEPLTDAQNQALRELGLFVVHFSSCVSWWELGVSWSVAEGNRQGMDVMTSIVSRMGAKELCDRYFFATAIVSPPASETDSRIRALLKNRCDRLITVRNDISHGSWSMISIDRTDVANPQIVQEPMLMRFRQKTGFRPVVSSTAHIAALTAEAAVVAELVSEHVAGVFPISPESGVTVEERLRLDGDEVVLVEPSGS